MKNAYFILKHNQDEVIIEKFHLCSWEYKDESASIEFGAELDLQSFSGSTLELKIYIPWLPESISREDLYKRLRDSANSKFIFNDIIDGTDSLDGGDNNKGVIHRFKGRGPLCILPVDITAEDKILTIKLNTSVLHAERNLYFQLPQMKRMLYKNSMLK